MDFDLSLMVWRVDKDERVQVNRETSSFYKETETIATVAWESINLLAFTFFRTSILFKCFGITQQLTQLRDKSMNMYGIIVFGFGVSIYCIVISSSFSTKIPLWNPWNSKIKKSIH